MENALLSYISLCAVDDLSNDLAESGDYDIEFHDYDWGLNSKRWSRSSSNATNFLMISYRVRVSA